jgi:hypothetical protein
VSADETEMNRPRLHRTRWRSPLSRQPQGVRPLEAWILATILVAGCASASRPPFELKEYLSLELETREVQVAKPIDLVYRIRNLKTEPIAVCLTDSGVSTWLKSPQTEQMLPVSWHGLVTDVRCATIVHIGASGGVTLRERVTIPAQWAGVARSFVLGGVFRASIEGAKGPFTDQNSTIQTAPTEVGIRE